MKLRKNIRLKEYDYKKSGYYFITICTHGMKNYFGEIVDNKVILNEKGLILKDIIEKYNENSLNVKNDYYQIMPNHLHIVIILIDDNKNSISSIVSGLKGKATRELRIKNLWQKSFYERVIRDEKEYNSIIKYINENPFRAKYQW